MPGPAVDARGRNEHLTGFIATSREEQTARRWGYSPKGDSYYIKDRRGSLGT